VRDRLRLRRKAARRRRALTRGLRPLGARAPGAPPHARGSNQHALHVRVAVDQQTYMLQPQCAQSLREIELDAQRTTPAPARDPPLRAVPTLTLTDASTDAADCTDGAVERERGRLSRVRPGVVGAWAARCVCWRLGAALAPRAPKWVCVCVAAQAPRVHQAHSARRHAPHSSMKSTAFPWLALRRVRIAHVQHVGSMCVYVQMRPERLSVG